MLRPKPPTVRQIIAQNAVKADSRPPTRWLQKNIIKIGDSWRRTIPATDDDPIGAAGQSAPFTKPGSGFLQAHTSGTDSRFRLKFQQTRCVAADGCNHDSNVETSVTPTDTNQETHFAKTFLLPVSAYTAFLHCTLSRFRIGGNHDFFYGSFISSGLNTSILLPRCTARCTTTAGCFFFLFFALFEPEPL